MEDALEPSLGASNSVVATRKGVVAAPKSAKEVCGQIFYFFIRICGLTNPCVFR
jgi:hypothetical protein